MGRDTLDKDLEDWGSPYSPLMKALEEAYQLGEENENRMERGMKALPVDEKLKEIRDRYFL